jgi:hypothetical protein
MRSWHDYHLTGYAVAGLERRISFELSWPYETATEVRHARLVFLGVEGYFFEHDLGGNILYSIEEEPLDDFLRENAQRFERERKWGWPLFWKGDVESTASHLSGVGAKVYDVSTSYGLSGWILAQSVEEHVLEV